MYTQHQQHPLEQLHRRKCHYWIDYTGKILWHDSPLSTDNTTEKTTPIVDNRNNNSSYVPLSEDDTFNDFNDSYC